MPPAKKSTSKAASAWREIIKAIKPSRKKHPDSAMHRNVFYVHRKPGKSSPKSFMLYPKVGPKFTSKTEQQEKIAEAGKYCGAIIDANPELFAGEKNVQNRRLFMSYCIKKQFEKEVPKQLEEKFGHLL